MDKYLRIATDGSGRTPKLKNSSWAWIAEDGRYSTGNLYNATNNQAELKAIEEAMFIPENIFFICDSLYSIRVLTNQTTKIRKNIDIIKRMKKQIRDRERCGLKTEFVWQRGHTKKKFDENTEIEVILNHFADTLCTKMRSVEDPAKIIKKSGVQMKLRERFSKTGYFYYEAEADLNANNIEIDEIVKNLELAAS